MRVYVFNQSGADEQVNDLNGDSHAEPSSLVDEILKIGELDQQDPTLELFADVFAKFQPATGESDDTVSFSGLSFLLIN